MPPQIVEGDSILQAINMAVGNCPSHLKSRDEDTSNALGFLYLAQELKFLTLKQKQPFNFTQQVSLGHALLIGEANFSFALSLINLQRGLSKNIHATVPSAQIHTSSQAKSNAAILKSSGAKIVYGVDGTRIQDRYARNAFQTIMFQFPNVASRKPLFNTNPNAILARQFLISARSVLKTNGKVIITTVDSPHYRGAFQFFDAAKRSGFNEPSIYPFFPSQFPGYEHENTQDGESAITDHDKFNTWVFQKNR